MSQVYSHSSEIRMADFVNLSVLQRIQDTFAKAMDVAAVTVDRNGKPVTATSNFSQVCLMVRSTPAGLKRCQWCDAEGGRRANDIRRPYAYLCAGGLLDAAAPIIIGGEYVGSILCGQVIPSDAQEETIQNIVKRNTPLGISRDLMEQAARSLMPRPRERFAAAVEMLSITANCIIEMSVANLAQAQLLQDAQERASLKAALQEAQLRAIKAQVNPHFLFNSLTLLGYTAQAEDASRTEEIAYCLSDLLRYSLRNTATLVELRDEFTMIEQFLKIHKAGMGDRLETRIELETALERFSVPCMVLQPLVENAIIHGVEPVSTPVTVSVRAFSEDPYVVLEVADNGAGISTELVNAINRKRLPEQEGSLGLQNVLQRLRGEYGDLFYARADGGPGRGAIIRLYIPNQEMQAQARHTSSGPQHLLNGSPMGLDWANQSSVFQREAGLLELKTFDMDAYKLVNIEPESIV